VGSPDRKEELSYFFDGTGKRPGKISTSPGVSTALLTAPIITRERCGQATYDGWALTQLPLRRRQREGYGESREIDRSETWGCWRGEKTIT